MAGPEATKEGAGERLAALEAARLATVAADRRCMTVAGRDVG